MLDVLKLDRPTLLAALEGRLATSECNPTLNRVPSSCQGLLLGNANIMSRFRVEGLGTINIPVPKAELKRLKSAGHKVKCTNGINAWKIETERITTASTLNTASSEFDYFDESLMTSAVKELGVDPVFHNVSVKPHQLLIYGQGEGAYTHAFEQEPGAFGVMLMQIPVEGGHEGGHMIVRSQLGSKKLERKEENGLKFYFTASFLDCAHEISAISEGWSLAMVFFLKWQTPIQVAPQLSSLSVHIVNLMHVRELLRPLVETEPCDTDLLVIPLKNSYKRGELRYSKLRDTDQLMASLLRSIPDLEIRLTFVVHFREGFANEEVRGTPHDDDGYPESDYEEGEPTVENPNKKRFITELLHEGYSIRNLLKLDGTKTDSGPPINWQTDYIDDGILDLGDVFVMTRDNPFAMPSKEEYSAMGHRPYLKQCFYKPVLVLWTKDSIVIDCRKDFRGTLDRLLKAVFEVTWDAQNENERQLKLLELRKVINFFYSLLSDSDKDESLDQEEHTLILIHLLNLCNALNAKQEGLHLFCDHASNPVLDWFEPRLLEAIAECIGLVGWKDCKEAIDMILDTVCDCCDMSFVINTCLIPLVGQLLFRNEPLRNEAAVIVFQRILTHLFPSPADKSLSSETFQERISSVIYDCAEDVFFHNILVLHHRRLLSRNTNLMALSQSYLTELPIHQLKPIVVEIASSTLIADFRVTQLTSQCRKLLESVCRRILKLNLHKEKQPDSSFILSICKLVVFIQNGTMLQQLITNICDVPLEKTRNNVLLKTILTLNIFQQNSSLQRMLKELKFNLLDRLRQYRRLAIAQLKSTESHLPACDDASCRAHFSAKLNNIVGYYVHNLPLKESLSEQDVLNESSNICFLLKLCNVLKNKDSAFLLFNTYSRSKDFDWSNDEVIKEFELFTRYSGSRIDIFNSIISTLKASWDTVTIVKRFLIKFEIVLLSQKKFPLPNSQFERFVHQKLINLIFPTSLSCVLKEEFGSKMSEVGESDFYLLVKILLLRDQRRLFESVHLIPSAIGYLETRRVDSLHPLVKELADSLIFTHFKFSASSDVCRQLLIQLRDRFLRHNPHTVPVNPLIDWIKLFVFIDDTDSLQQLVDKICISSSGVKGNDLAKKLLKVKDILTPKFKVVREMLDSTVQQPDKIQTGRKKTIKRSPRSAVESGSPSQESDSNGVPVMKRMRINETVQGAQSLTRHSQLASKDESQDSLKYGCVVS